jgi:caffeoyl-CoA O-methyltransferase
MFSYLVYRGLQITDRAFSPGDYRMMKLKLLLILTLFPLLFSHSGCNRVNQSDLVYDGLEESKAVLQLKRFPEQYRLLNVPPADGRFLYDLVLQHKYRRGLEIGTANGYSAIWLGMAFRKTGGKLITIEIDPDLANEARQNLRWAGLTEFVDTRTNDAFKEIPQIEGTFDFVFIDAWKADYKKFFDLLFPRVVPGGAITAHNVIDSADELAEFLQGIQSNPQLETTIQKTSNRGISVSIRKP